MDSDKTRHGRGFSAKFLAAFCLVFLVGCTDAPADSPETSKGNRQSTSVEGVLETAEIDCEGVEWYGYFPVDRVQQQLPPGYVATGLGAIAAIYLEFYRCSSATIHNRTESDFMLAIAQTPLDEANGHMKGTGTNFFVLEMFLDVEAVPDFAALLLRYGFPVKDADIHLDRDTATISSEDSTYSTTAELVDCPCYLGGARRSHAFEGVPSYFDLTVPDGQGPTGTGMVTSAGSAWSEAAGDLPWPTQAAAEVFRGQLGFWKEGPVEDPSN